MNENYFFMHRARRTNGVFDKGIEVKESYDGAKQSFHAYLGAYAYDRHDGTDFVQCIITDMSGTELMKENWLSTKPKPAPEPEPEPEPQPEPEPEET